MKSHWKNQVPEELVIYYISSLICTGFQGICIQIWYKRIKEWNTVHGWIQICPAATVTLCRSLCSFGLGKKHWFVCSSTGKCI